MSDVWTVIVVAGLGTFAMRASFIAAAHRLAHVPAWAQRLLRQVPSAALASLVLPAFVRPEGSLHLAHPRSVAGLLATVVAWKTGSVAWTLVVGIAAVMALEAL